MLKFRVTIRKTAPFTNHKDVKTLSADESIKVCEFDKGRGTVVLNSVDYQGLTQEFEGGGGTI